MPSANVRRDGTGNTEPRETMDPETHRGGGSVRPAHGPVVVGTTGSIGRTQMLRNCTGLPWS